MLLRKDFHKSFPFKRSEKNLLNTSIVKKLDLTASQTFFVVVLP